MKALTVKCVIRFLEDNEKNHLYQVYYRVTKNRKSEYIPSGLMVMASDWDNKSGRYKEVYRNNAQKIVLHKNNNKQLEQRINEIKIALSEIPVSNTMTSKKAKRTILENDVLGTKNVKDFFDEVIKGAEWDVAIGTRKSYIYARNRFEKFAGKDITFSEITGDLLNKFIDTLKKDGRNGNTIHCLLKVIRALYNKAIAKKVANKKQYLSAFEGVKSNSLLEKTIHRALSDAEINKLKRYKPKNDSEKLALSVFLFSYYNAGINIKDIAILKAEHIKGGTLTYTRKKTHDPIIMTLHKKSYPILKRVKNTSDYLFPILEGCNVKNDKKVYNRISLVTNKINSKLIEIGDNLKLDIDLTTYVARHSYSTTLYRKGQSADKIGQALHHKNKKTTEIYLARFPNKDIAKMGDLL